ncbi:TatD family hydrolase [Marinomonas algicola]|uniref:TatD family hydrolase n=1 Tax=Marinomonas algicola TaxID=2773454 RepID=UPI00174A4DE2|nr:TatD family hydrolase [Marinomonas algicola]
MIDIGVNLNSIIDLAALSEFQAELTAANISKVIAISSNLAESDELIELSKTHPNSSIRYTIGCHPHHASEWNEDTTSSAITLIRENSPVAVGETGLDFNRNFSTPKQQIFAFDQQIQIAKEMNLPLFLHEREAEDTVIGMLSNATHLNGVIHCFTGNKETLKRYLDLGLYIGITGWLCDERRGHDLQEAVKYIPNNRLLIETDAPYLIPRNIRPRPRKNHPKFLPYIINELARIREQSVEEIEKITHMNARRLFNI